MAGPARPAKWPDRTAELADQLGASMVPGRDCGSNDLVLVSIEGELVLRVHQPGLVILKLPGRLGDGVVLGLGVEPIDDDFALVKQRIGDLARIAGAKGLDGERADPRGGIIVHGYKPLVGPEKVFGGRLFKGPWKPGDEVAVRWPKHPTKGVVLVQFGDGVARQDVSVNREGVSVGRRSKGRYPAAPIPGRPLRDSAGSEGVQQHELGFLET